LFAVSSIANLIQYYDIFQKKKAAVEHDLRIATIFTYGANEEDEDAIDLLPDFTMSMAAEPQAAYK
jgi:type I restriction enzyme R subunit